MDVAIKGCLGKGDFVQFRQSEGTLLLAEVVAAVSDDRLRCRIYSPMTTSMMRIIYLIPDVQKIQKLAQKKSKKAKRREKGAAQDREKRVEVERL